MRSILNGDREVIVGNKLYKYISSTLGLSVDIGAAQELKDAVHNLSEHATASEVYDEVMNFDINGEVEIFYFDGGSRFGGLAKVTKTTFDNFHITIPTQRFPDACNNPRKLRLENLILNDLDLNNWSTTQNKASYTIDWGDGSTPTTATSLSGLNQSILSSVEHTYSSYGNYDINIKAKSISPTNSGFSDVAELDINNVEIGPRNCLFGYGKAINNAVWKNSNGVAWAATCWVNMNKNWVGWDFNRAGAQTVIYHQDGSKWKGPREGFPYVEFTLAKTDDQCNTQGNWIGKSHYNSVNKAKSAVAQIKFNNNFGWTSFTSNHQSYHNGQWNANHFLNLYSCQ